MKQRTLADWLLYAEQVHPVGIDLGLDRVRIAANRLGVLPPAARNIVIAGTNGKGSTSVYLEGLLMARGYRVGTTLSPHLSRFNERIRLNGEPVGDEILCDAFATIEAARAEVTLTYFEFGILAALLVFRRANVDVTVLEVGLGGRLDAVNVVDGTVTVITSIGIDHVAYLGPDRESIGAEKAGILRAGVPCVFGEAAIPQSVATAARKQHAPLLVYGTDFCAHGVHDTWRFEGRRGSMRTTATNLTLPQVALCNAATALQAFLMLDPEAAVAALVAGAAGARLPARFECFEYRAITVIVDVAHNPHGAAFMARQLSARPCNGRTVAVAGFLQDKDAAGIVAALETVIDEWVFVATEGARGQLGSVSAQKAGLSSEAIIGGDFGEALDAAVQRCGADDRLVVLGSFDVAQRARAKLTDTMFKDEASGGH